MKKEITAQEMLVKMAGLCAGAEQSSSDIRKKILKKGFSTEEASRMIEYLVKNKYIDDDRYSRAYAVDKVRFSCWGRMKIRLGLRGKGMTDSVIAQALAYISEDEYMEALVKAMKAKSRSLDLSDVKERQKLYRHLATRGFESELIIREMRKLMSGKVWDS